MTWDAKETIRQVYSIDDCDLACEFVDQLIDDLEDDSMPPEVRSLGHTITRWRYQITARHKARVSNGPTEAVNNLVKRIKRVAFGITNFRNYRIRVLLYAGKPNWDLPLFAPLERGTYFMDPDLDPSTPLRVVYEVPVEGWSMWSGAVKFGDDDGHIAVSITTVTNLVRDGCRDHSWADPPVGPTVDDLATALTDLAPFRVTSPPEDVTAYGYNGRYLELTVPNLPVEGSGDDRRFTECIGGDLKSWVAPFDTEPGDAFYGYTGSGYTEEFWILDVEGTRLVIAAERSAGSPPEDLAELHAILDSIRIEQ